MTVTGLTISEIEGWPFGDGPFAFFSELTIGYGDLVPEAALARVLTVSIGVIAILLSGLVATNVVQALQAAARDTCDEWRANACPPRRLRAQRSWRTRTACCRP